MTTVLAGYHVSPRCIRVDFDGPMRNNDDLRDASNYTIGAGSPAVTAVYVPTVQESEYDPLDPNPNGGKPLSMYLMLDSDPYVVSNPINAAVSAVGPTAPIDYYAGAVLLAPLTVSVVTCPTFDAGYGGSNGLRLSQAFSELSKLGKPSFGGNQPVNRSMAKAIAFIAEMISGGFLTALVGSVAGEDYVLDAVPLPGMGGGGFPGPDSIEPGLGDTIEFSELPIHVDKLWGPCNDSNRLFRTSIAYHSFACTVLLISRYNDDSLGRTLDPTEWYAPNSGDDRLVKLLVTPPTGSAVFVMYMAKQSIVRIDKEILAYNQSDLATNTALICGRGQLCTDLAEHTSGAVIEDVWSASAVGRVTYSLLSFGASGAALDALALDSGAHRADNPRLSDTQLRRMIFNTAVTQRATPVTAVKAFKYIYPNLWPYVFVTEDPRWPGCLVVWYSGGRVRDDIALEPDVEPWEDWLDHKSYSDGFPLCTYYATYYRDPITDVTYDGDYYLDGPGTDDTDWPYPVILSGPDIYLLGSPAPYLPLPVWVSPTDYRQFLVRPSALDRVLPIGTGVLLLDTAFIS